MLYDIIRYLRDKYRDLSERLNANELICPKFEITNIQSKICLYMTDHQKLKDQCITLTKYLLINS